MFRRFLNFIERLFGGDLDESKPVQNYPDLKEKPKTWALQYQGELMPKDRDFMILDLFSYSKEQVESLKNAGVTVYAYFSLHAEDWRPDYHKFKELSLDSDLDGWRGEDVVSPKYTKELIEIMKARIDLAIKKGFQGIDPDNVDAWYYYLGGKGDKKQIFSTAAYWNEVARYAREKGLACGLKNSAFLYGLVKPDFIMCESAYKWSEIEGYLRFNVPVFNIEYDFINAERASKDSRIFSMRKKKKGVGSMDHREWQLSVWYEMGAEEL